MIPKTIFSMFDGVRVVVPDSLQYIVTYSLFEQQDWFEDEIKFVRKLLKPGQKAFDIGASFGLYTLSMAKCVGPTGRVWAFEPVMSTGAMLSESIMTNGFMQITLEQKALSDECGTARMVLNSKKETSAILRGEPTGEPTETVQTTTLDEFQKNAILPEISFVKMDAEGEEPRILKGGRQFFNSQSPLVQYEIKLTSEPCLDLVELFSEMGYDSYRLVPGLDLLVPFDPKAPVDSFALNLFCCKPDRAARLAADGFLVQTGELTPELHQSVIETAKSQEQFGWRRTIAKMPYGELLLKTWKSTLAKGESNDVCEGLALFALSRDESRSKAERFAALQVALQRFTKLCEGTPKYLRRASLARISIDFGARARGVHSLWQLYCNISTNRRADTSEPFLAPMARFDTISPREAVGSWVIAATSEAYEKKCAFSTFYSGSKSLDRLQSISDLGYGDEEMKRRLYLVQRCITEFGETK
ncbi:MAG: FkbM family methyltransferase [Pirellulaceae bacterium]|nr:FkbM family methyltransferase [Pirellulaceae bacterium]